MAGTPRERSASEASDRAAVEERARLAAVRRYAALDGLPEGMFDRVVDLAARFLATPIAAVTIVDEQRIRFAAQCGLGALAELPREPGLCDAAILRHGPHLVSDAAADPRARDNWLVRGEPGVRFYAAAPITTPEGHRLGAVSAMDRRPRGATPEELRTLGDLAAVVAGILELRLSAAGRAVEAERGLRAQLEREKALLEQIATLEAEQAAQLQHALKQRVAIEQAKGVLMTQEGLDEQAAFQRLREVARSRRRPVEEIAVKVLAGEPLPVPLRSARERPRSRRGQQAERPSQPRGRGGTVDGLSDGILRITPTVQPPGLRLEGEVDHTNSKLLADALATAAAVDRDLHLDLEKLEFIGVGGLRLLVETAARQPAGRQLVVEGMAPYLRRIMRLVGWDQLPGLRFGRAGRAHGSS